VIGKIAKAMALEGVTTLKPVVTISIKILKREADFISPNYKKVSACKSTQMYKVSCF
jgi:hypothetical protein